MTTDDSGTASDQGRGSLPDDVIEERFAAIVAGYDQPGDWPSDPPPEEGETSEQAPEHSSGANAGEGSGDVGPTILSIPVWRGATGPSLLDETAEDADDDFVPDPVDLPPTEDLHYWGAVIGLVLGPIVVIYVAIAQPFYATWWLLGGLGLCVGGFALLVLRSPHKRDHEDDDSGARV